MPSYRGTQRRENRAQLIKPLTIDALNSFYNARNLEDRMLRACPIVHDNLCVRNPYAEYDIRQACFRNPGHVQLRGRTNTEPCTRCRNGCGPYSACRSVAGYKDGACGGCAHGGHHTECDFYTGPLTEKQNKRRRAAMRGSRHAMLSTVACHQTRAVQRLRSKTRDSSSHRQASPLPTRSNVIRRLRKKCGQVQIRHPSALPSIETDDVAPEVPAQTLRKPASQESAPREVSLEGELLGSHVIGTPPYKKPGAMVLSHVEIPRRTRKELDPSQLSTQQILDEQLCSLSRVVESTEESGLISPEPEVDQSKPESFHPPPSRSSPHIAGPSRARQSQPRLPRTPIYSRLSSKRYLAKRFSTSSKGKARVDTLPPSMPSRKRKLSTSDQNTPERSKVAREFVAPPSSHGFTAINKPPPIASLKDHRPPSLSPPRRASMMTTPPASSPGQAPSTRRDTRFEQKNAINSNFPTATIPEDDFKEPLSPLIPLGDIHGLPRQPFAGLSGSARSGAGFVLTYHVEPFVPSAEQMTALNSSPTTAPSRANDSTFSPSLFDFEISEYSSPRSSSAAEAPNHPPLTPRFDGPSSSARVTRAQKDPIRPHWEEYEDSSQALQDQLAVKKKEMQALQQQLADLETRAKVMDRIKAR